MNFSSILKHTALTAIVVTLLLSRRDAFGMDTTISPAQKAFDQGEITVKELSVDSPEKNPQLGHSGFAKALVQNKTAVGAMRGHFERSLNGFDSAHIDRLDIYKNFQRQGYGKLFLEIVCKQFVAQDITSVDLVSASNSVGFYLKCGFKRTDIPESDLPYVVGLEMSKDLEKKEEAV